MNKNILEEYLDVCDKMDELQKKKDSLNTVIKSMLCEEPDLKFEDDTIQASMTESVTFKVIDDVAVINYLMTKGLKSKYLTEKLDTTKFNKEMKAGGTLCDDLSKYVDKSITQRLIVKRK